MHIGHTWRGLLGSTHMEQRFCRCSCLVDCTLVLCVCVCLCLCVWLCIFIALFRGNQGSFEKRCKSVMNSPFPRRYLCSRWRACTKPRVFSICRHSLGRVLAEHKLLEPANKNKCVCASCTFVWMCMYMRVSVCVCISIFDERVISIISYNTSTNTIGLFQEIGIFYHHTHTLSLHFSLTPFFSLTHVEAHQIILCHIPRRTCSSSLMHFANSLEIARRVVMVDEAPCKSQAVLPIMKRHLLVCMPD